VKPEVDGSTLGSAIASAAGMSVQELAAVLEEVPSGVIIADRRGRPVVANRAARRILGDYARTSRSLIDVSVEAGLREVRTGRLVSPETSVLARTLRGEAISSEEYTLALSPDKADLRLRISSVPLRDWHGAITGAVSVFTDVGADSTHADRIERLFEMERRARAETEQALAQLEQELAVRLRAEEALQGSQQRFRLALEASHMGTWDYDLVKETFTEWSPEMANLTGRTVESLHARRSLADAFLPVHPDDRTALEQAIRDALERDSGLQIETRFKHGPTNTIRWLLLKGRVYRDTANRRPLRVTGVAMDITAHKEAEAARHAMAHGERLRALGEMASGIAHDLNQSLALISGYSDMARQELLHHKPELERVREMVAITARAALEGGQALRGLLTFVRSQELLSASERFDVGEVLTDVARLTAPRWRDAPQAEGRPIELDVAAQPGCWINGSPAALREAITNLIFNAVDALPRGGAVHLVTYQDGEHTMIDVCDTGEGIPKDVQARVFDPFFSTKGAHGTGLGLPQVRSIVERHGGSIELHSTPNRGTTFRLVFPSAASATGTTTKAAETAVDEPQRCIRILVVEDEEQLARMASLVLTQRGYEVVVASSGEEALDHLQRDSFELIISDLGLGPGKNGWDVAAAVRQQSPDSRVVLVTGWGAAIDPEEARKRGVDEVIAKPYRIADLRQVADRVASGLDNE
jgi:PAS domain S-box-containing protein